MYRTKATDKALADYTGMTEREIARISLSTRETLEYLMQEALFLKDFKTYLDDRQFTLQIEELKLSSQNRLESLAKNEKKAAKTQQQPTTSHMQDISALGIDELLDEISSYQENRMNLDSATGSTCENSTSSVQITEGNSAEATLDGSTCENSTSSIQITEGNSAEATLDDFPETESSKQKSPSPNSNGTENEESLSPTQTAEVNSSEVASERGECDSILSLTYSEESSENSLNEDNENRKIENFDPEGNYVYENPASVEVMMEVSQSSVPDIIMVDLDSQGAENEIVIKNLSN